MVFIVLLCFAIRETYNFIVWINGLFNDYHKLQDHKEDQEATIKKLEKKMDMSDEEMKRRFEQLDDIDKKVCDLEQTMSKHGRSLDKLWDGIESLQESIEAAKVCRNSYTLASSRSILYDLYKQGITQGYTDQAAYETFESLKDIYLELGGNSVFKNKLIGEYEALPIRGVDQDK